jgi:hypothetical protein
MSNKKLEKEVVLSSVANKRCHHLTEFFHTKIKKKDIYLCITCGKLVKSKPVKTKIVEIQTVAQQLQFDGICKLFGTKIKVK